MLIRFSRLLSSSTIVVLTVGLLTGCAVADQPAQKGRPAVPVPAAHAKKLVKKAKTKKQPQEPKEESLAPETPVWCCPVARGTCSARTYATCPDTGAFLEGAATDTEKQKMCNDACLSGEMGADPTEP